MKRAADLLNGLRRLVFLSGNIATFTRMSQDASQDLALRQRSMWWSVGGARPLLLTGTDVLHTAREVSKAYKCAYDRIIC